MSAGNLGHEDVKSICDKLEASPSQHDDTGKWGGAPNITPTAKSSESATTGTHLKTHTDEFKMTDRGAKIPQFQKQFANKVSEHV